MNGRNHAIVGAASGIAVGIAAASAGSWEVAALAVPAAMFGAKLPDADHKATKQGKIFYAFRRMVPIIAVISIIGYVFLTVKKNIAINPLIVAIPIAAAWALRDGAWFWGHRHGTHTLLFPAVFLLIYFMYRSVAPVISGVLLALTAGYISHLIADMETKDGIFLLYPVIKTKIHLTNVKSAEEGKCRVMAIITGAIFCIISIILSF